MDNRNELIAALKLALPIVERVAATAPTEPTRQKRQQEAARAAVAIRTAINVAELTKSIGSEVES